MLSGIPVVYGIDPQKTDSVAQHDFGAVGKDKYGDTYRYAKVSEDISAGYLTVSPDPGTTQVNLSVASAASVGDKEISITLGAAAVTANEYAGGYLVFNDVAPEGRTYRISSHPASEGSEAVTFKLERALDEAATTSSQVTLVQNQWNGVQTSTTQTLVPTGVTQVDISSGEYGWVKTRGVSAVLADENGTLGNAVTIGSSTAGAVEEIDDGDDATPGEPVVGLQIIAMANTEFRPIYLTID